MRSIEIDGDSEFSMDNIPFGVFSRNDPSTPHCATRVGDTVVDLSVLQEADCFHGIEIENSFSQSTLNGFLECSKKVWRAVRQRLQQILAAPMEENLYQVACHNVKTVQLHLPIAIGDYTDFYSSREHATNVGSMVRSSQVACLFGFAVCFEFCSQYLINQFRDPKHALNPNWLHLPVGYHGRASTVFVSGTDFHRPCGQLHIDETVQYGPSRLLDFELEVAAVVGGPPNKGPISMEQAQDRIFGLLLMNDWSARDIQKWEYVPLGPFTAKNFCTTVSPWIVTLDALQQTAPKWPQVDPTPLPYLQNPGPSYDIQLSASIKTPDQDEAYQVCQTNFKDLYWTVTQQLVHHSVTGCIMKAGDLLGSGTISAESSYGSMLELSWKGSREVPVGATARKFLQDGDTVILNGVSQKPGSGKVGFGDCSGTILPVLSIPMDAISSVPIQRYASFRLYSYYRSSATWRVRIALAAKSIEYETIVVNLDNNEHKATDYLEKNPAGQVPVLECLDSFTGETINLTQSLAIIQFLEDAFPERAPLIPKHPVQRAKVMEMAELINAGTQPLQNVFFLKQMQEISGGAVQGPDVAKMVIERGLGAVEKLVVVDRGPYASGSFSPTLADVCIVPQVYNARRFGVDIDTACPRLVQIDKLCADHAWFQPAHPSKQPDAPN